MVLVVTVTTAGDEAAVMEVAVVAVVDLVEVVLKGARA